LLSVFIMYSNDRLEALSHTLACLRSMSGYSECQRTLVVDGRVDRVPEDWDVVQVPRLGGEFCWGAMWDAGVYSSKHEKVFYLDSDRMLPRNFIKIASETVRDNTFLFTSRHFSLVSKIPIEVCQRILELDDESLFSDNEFVGKFRYETRHRLPFHGSGKNVMSGSVVFTKSTYRRLGGVDHWYRGHGAFADSDFHMVASVSGCEFVDTGLTELHYPHEKFDAGVILNNKSLYRKSLDNFIYYCDKWRLPARMAENMAAKSGISRPASYVSKKIKEIK
jgi:hypothetical protein